MPKEADPGMFWINPDRSINGTTAKQVYSFTHFDAWAYGTDFFAVSLFKSGPERSTSPCVTPASRSPAVPPTVPAPPKSTACSARPSASTRSSTLKAFTMGPLRNVSFEVGMDANTENNFLAPAKRDVVAGLQFAFDLPYKGYVNIAPLMYWEFSNHNSFTQCGLVRVPAFPEPPATRTAMFRTGRHGRSKSITTWTSASCRRTCSTSRSAAAPAGTDRRAISTGLPALSGPGRFSTASKTEFNSEPIRPDVRRQQGLHGPEVLALRRPLGRLIATGRTSSASTTTRCPASARSPPTARAPVLMHRVRPSMAASR